MGFMGYLRGFVPWIIAGVISSFDWRLGALGGIVSGLLLILQDRRRGVALDALILEVSTVVYFVVIGAVAFAGLIRVWLTTRASSPSTWLAATAWGSLAIRRPFTMGIAKRQTPREYWDMPEFVQVNDHITSAWGTGFTLHRGQSDHLRRGAVRPRRLPAHVERHRRIHRAVRHGPGLEGPRRTAPLDAGAGLRARHRVAAGRPRGGVPHAQRDPDRAAEPLPAHRLRRRHRQARPRPSEQPRLRDARQPLRR